MKNSLSILDHSLLDAIHDIAHIIIADVRSGRQTEANLEDRLRHPVDISRSILIYRLPVHRFPYRTALHPLRKYSVTRALPTSHFMSTFVGVRTLLGRG